MIHTYSQPATVCSQSYPVLKYTVSLLTISSTLSVDLLPSLTTASCNPPLAVTVDSSNVPELAVDREYGLTVTACSNITCRTTNSVTACKKQSIRCTTFFLFLRIDKSLSHCRYNWSSKSQLFTTLIGLCYLLVILPSVQEPLDVCSILPALLVKMEKIWKCLT